jgi:hypothetical protein
MKSGDMNKCINNMTFRFCVNKIWSKFGVLALENLKSKQKHKELYNICNYIKDSNVFNLQSIFMKKLTDKHIGRPQIIDYVENRVYEKFGYKAFVKLGFPHFNLIDPVYRAIRHEINQSKN